MSEAANEIVETVPPESHEPVEAHPVELTEARVQEMINGSLEGIKDTLNEINTKVTHVAEETVTATTEVPTEVAEIVADPVEEVFDDSPPKTYRGPLARAAFQKRAKK